MRPGLHVRDRAVPASSDAIDVSGPASSCRTIRASSKPICARYLRAPRAV
jgi:hypothetical protein